MTKKHILISLDPETCQSTAQAMITQPRIITPSGRNSYDGCSREAYIQYSASLTLTDCSRRIEWDFTSMCDGKGPPYNMKKIDRAIEALCRTRAAMRDNVDLIKALRQKVKVINRDRKRKEKVK